MNIEFTIKRKITLIFKFNEANEQNTCRKNINSEVCNSATHS